MNCSGMSADDLYVPTLWCFEELSFLLNANDEICGEASIDLTDFSNNARPGSQNNNSQISLHSNASPTPSSSGSSRKRSRVYSEVTDLRLTAQKSLKILDSFVKNDRTPTEEKREELLTKMICAEIKKFKYEETYDNFTSGVFALLLKAKEQERRSLSASAHISNNFMRPLSSLSTYSYPSSASIDSHNSSSISPELDSNVANYVFSPQTTASWQPTSPPDNCSDFHNLTSQLHNDKAIIQSVVLLPAKDASNIEPLHTNASFQPISPPESGRNILEEAIKAINDAEAN